MPARIIILKSLGVFWLIDGLLQFQPKMFAPDFVNNVLTPNLAGQPGVLRSTVMLGISAWSAHPLIANIFAALLQIAIGVFLLLPDSDKKISRAIEIGLYLSIVWGVLVWIFGEGAGSLFTGSASFYTGAPGAALIYALISALLLFPKKITATWFPKIAGWIIVACAFLQPQPVLLFCLTVLIGLMLAIKPNRVAGVVALIFLFGVWWLGQNFGGLTTLIVGTATDPNTEPILALLLIPIFFTASSTGRRYSKQP